MRRRTLTQEELDTRHFYRRPLTLAADGVMDYANVDENREGIFGVPLDFYKQELSHVSEEFDDDPIKTLSIESIIERLRVHEKDIRHYRSLNDNDSFEKVVDWEHSKTRLHREWFSEFSFDELAKFWLSSTIQTQIHHLFQPSWDDAMSLEHRLIGKIESSRWRWGVEGGEKWNTLVDFHRAIRTFDFGIEGFEVRLDYSTYYNEKGWSEFSRTYLDGAFGYLIYYKGKHVLTIGFSLCKERHILIQQIQLKNPKGNRWLFKIKNLREHVIDRMFATFGTNFPNNFTFAVPDGWTLATSIRESYGANNNGKAPDETALKRVETFWDAPYENYVRTSWRAFYKVNYFHLTRKK